MTEFSGLPGQIMHSPTVEKMIQPNENKSDLAAQQAAAQTDELADNQRRAVQKTSPGEQNPIDERDPNRDRDGREKKRRKKQAGPEEGEEASAKSGGLIDVVV